MSDSDAREKIISAVRDYYRRISFPVGYITENIIAQRAGVGTGTVSYHFQSKDKLVYEVIAGQMVNLAERLSPREGVGTPFERLKHFFYQTAELALQYREIFRVQLSYEILNSDLSICYYITPLLKEYFDGSKSDLEIKIIALQMISAMQVILLKMEEFQRYSGINIQDTKQREEALDIILSTASKS